MGRAFLLSLFLHILVIVLGIWGLDWINLEEKKLDFSLPEVTLEQNDLPELAQNTPIVEPLAAESVSSESVEKFYQKLKKDQQSKTSANKAAAAEKRALEKKIAALKKKQRASESKLKKSEATLKKKQREKAAVEAAIKKKKREKAAAEKAAKKAAAKRLAEEKKQKALAKKRREEAARKKAAAEKARKALEAKRKAEAARQHRLSEQAKYAALIRSKVQSNWTQIPGQSGLSVLLQVKLSSAGEVQTVNVISGQGSGDASFDAAAVRAVLKASPLPVPSDQALFDELFKAFKFRFTP